MNVKELIRELQKISPDQKEHEVRYSENFNSGNFFYRVERVESDGTWIILGASH